MRTLTVKHISNFRGTEWTARLQEWTDKAVTGVATYASTAAVAEAKLRAKYDCKGLVAEIIDRPLKTIVVGGRYQKGWVQE